MAMLIIFQAWLEPPLLQTSPSPSDRVLESGVPPWFLLPCLKLTQWLPDDGLLCLSMGVLPATKETIR